MHVRQGSELEYERLGGSCSARERRRQHEGDELVAVGFVSERNRSRLVLTDGFEHFSER